jgi:hypothetical protein
MHKHAHSHAHKAAAAPRETSFSLLRLSAGERLGLVLVALVLLWGGVYWALT